MQRTIRVQWSIVGRWGSESGGDWERDWVLRARLLCLPVNLEAATPIWAALVTKGSTWLSHTQELAHLFGIKNDFLETPGVAQLLRHGLDSDVKRAVHLWKTQILLPHFHPGTKRIVGNNP